MCLFALEIVTALLVFFRLIFTILLFSVLQGYKLGEVSFLRDGIYEVIKCRKVLKWTYVFAYYMDEGREKELFEFLQEDLEKNLEYLHELIEREVGTVS